MAEAGHSFGLESDGRITSPGWAERRRASRRTVRLPATIVLGGEAVIAGATLRDVSTGGLGIECHCVAPEGTSVSVRIVGNRQFEGRIAWTNGERIGAELDRQLYLDDPLIQTS